MPRFAGTLVETTNEAQAPSGPRFKGIAVADSAATSPAPPTSTASSQAQMQALDLPVPAPGGGFDPRFQPAGTPTTPVTSLSNDISGTAANATAGINDAIITTLGAPVDLTRTGINMLTGRINDTADTVGRLTGTDIPDIPQLDENSIGGRRSLAQALEVVGINDPDKVVAANNFDRAIRAAGEGVGYAVAPELLLTQLGRMGVVGDQAMQVLGQVFGNSNSVRSTVGNAIAGATGGAGAEIAEQAAPEPLKPLAATVGGVAGGLTGALVAETPNLVRAGVRAASDLAAPLTNSGRERLAGERLAAAADNPQGVVQAINEAPAPAVAGSQPTTFQQTGDLGLGALERGVAARDPAAFNQRRADQNAARTGAVEGLQTSGAPEQVAAAARTFIGDIEKQADEAIAAIENAATARTTAAQQASAGAVQGAERAALDAAQGLGQGIAPEVAGANMRQSLEAARATAKEQERALWRAVDPDGTLALPATSIREQVGRLIAERPVSAKAPTDEEAAIFSVAGQYGEVVPFSELTALQSRIKAELRAERIANGESPAYRRLSLLNSAVQDDLDSAVAGRVAQDAEAVAAGELDPEQTLEALLRRQIEEFRAARNQETGAGGGSGAVGLSGGRAPSPSRPAGTAGSPEFGPGGTSGNPRLSADAPNFDADALERLNTARAATRSRVETFDNNTLGPIRQRPSPQSPYDQPNAGVPSRIFFPGQKSPEAINAFRRAVGDEQALPVLRDYAVDRFRRAALRQDGTIDPSKAQAWLRQHADALRTFPALSSAIMRGATASDTAAATATAQREILRDVERAGAEQVTDVTRMQKQIVDEAQRGIIGRVMGLEDPQDVTRTVGSIFQRNDAAREMARLRNATKGNPAAAEGLRKAVVDHIIDRFVSNTEAATSGLGAIKSDQFQTFVSQNKAALRNAGFSEEEIGVLQSVADDLQQANRSIAAVRIPGGSNTAQDVLAAGAGDTPSTILTKLVLASAASGGAVGAASNPLAGAATTVGVGLLGALRQAGLNTVDDIVKDALLNPQRAKILLMKVKPQDIEKASITLGQRFTRSVASEQAQELEGER